jgi:hypothetical protein
MTTNSTYSNISSKVFIMYVLSFIATLLIRSMAFLLFWNNFIVRLNNRITFIDAVVGSLLLFLMTKFRFLIRRNTIKKYEIDEIKKLKNDNLI